MLLLQRIIDLRHTTAGKVVSVLLSILVVLMMTNLAMTLSNAWAEEELAQRQAECTHNYSETAVTPPNCVDGGFTTHTCVICQHSYTDDHTNPTGHDYELTITRDATCSLAGMNIYKCKVCGDSYEEETQMLVCDWHSDPMVVEPTCTEAGSLTFYCKNNAEHTYLIITHPLGHNTEGAAWTINEAEGTHSAICATCGQYVNEAHNDNGYVTPVPATCTTSGVAGGSYCDVCGYGKDAAEAVIPSGHAFDEGVITEATCLADRYTTYTCTLCGTQTIEVDEGTKASHDAEWETTKESTCTQEGEQRGTCTQCGNEVVEPIPAAGHQIGKNAKWRSDAASGTHYRSCALCNMRFDEAPHVFDESVEHKDATCQESGVAGGQYCSVCEEGKAAAEAEIPVVAHDLDDVEWSFDDSTGEHYKVCRTCDSHFEVGTHVFGSWQEFDATCTEDACTKQTCEVCGFANIVVDASNPKLGHQFGDWAALSSDAEDYVTSHQRVCAACGETEIQEHTLQIEEGVPATCAKDGITEGRYCSVCKTTLSTPQVIPATGHTEIIDAAQSATCTETGLTEGKHCSVCDEVLVAQETVSATGHNAVLEPARPATCTQQGLTEGARCSVCDESITAQETIPALGHDMVVDAAVPATCETTGLTAGSHCTRCDDATTAQEVTLVLGHTVAIDPAVDATCETAGLTSGTHCSACDRVLIAQSVVPALGHAYEWTTIMPASYESAGLEQLVCTRDRSHTSDTRSIAQLVEATEDNGGQSSQDDNNAAASGNDQGTTGSSQGPTAGNAGQSAATGGSQGAGVGNGVAATVADVVNGALENAVVSPVVEATGGAAAIADETATPATEAIDDDANPLASFSEEQIADDGNPLASFELEATPWIIWMVSMGVIALGCAGASIVLTRRNKSRRRM